jgi:hypothetical protein
MFWLESKIPLVGCWLLPPALKGIIIRKSAINSKPTSHQSSRSPSPLSPHFKFIDLFEIFFCTHLVDVHNKLFPWPSSMTGTQQTSSHLLQLHQSKILTRRVVAAPTMEFRRKEEQTG